MKYNDYIQILAEAKIDGSGEYYQRIDAAKFIELYREHCKDYDPKYPIYRGSSDSHGAYGVVEGQNGGRKSQNTKNYYTVIFDKIIASQNPKYPLRSKSIIATTYKDYAAKYGSLYNIIPFDNVLIGLVPDKDIWGIEINGFELDTINKRLDHAGIKDTSFGDIVSGLKNLDPKIYISQFEKIFGDQANIESGLLKAYDMKSLGFKYKTTADKFNNHPTETWIGGKCLMIHHRFHDMILNHHQEIVGGYDVMVKDNLRYYTIDDYVDFGDAVIVNTKKFKFIDITEYDFYEKISRDDLFGKVLIKYVGSNELDEYKEMIADDDFKKDIGRDSATIAYYLNKFQSTDYIHSYYKGYSGIKIKYHKERDIDVTFAFYKIDGVVN